jgi:hypothetical protein
LLVFSRLAIKVFDSYRLLLAAVESEYELSFVVATSVPDELLNDVHASIFGNRWNTEAFGDTWQDLLQDHELLVGATPEQLLVANVPPVYAEAWWMSQRKRLLDLFSQRSTNQSYYVYYGPKIVRAAKQLRSIQAIDRVCAVQYVKHA